MRLTSTTYLFVPGRSFQTKTKSKQRHRKQIYEFVVLNHVLSSNVASLTADMIQEEPAELKEFLKENPK